MLVGRKLPDTQGQVLAYHVDTLVLVNMKLSALANNAEAYMFIDVRKNRARYKIEAHSAIMGDIGQSNGLKVKIAIGKGYNDPQHCEQRLISVRSRWNVH